MSYRNRVWPFAVGLVLALVSATCSDPTGPGATHPEGIIERSDDLDARPYSAAISRQDVVYITQLDNQRLSRIDLPALGETDNVAVQNIPTDVAFNAAGTRAYVANQFSRTISVIDVGTNRQTSTISTTHDVFEVLPDAGENRLYVVTNADRLYQINRATGAVVTSIPLPGTGQGLVFHPNGYLLYVSTFTGGSVLEVDTRSMTIVRTFETGSKAQEAVVTRDGRELWVADEDLEKVDVFDLGSGEKLRSIHVGGHPWGMAITPDQQQVYVGLVFEGEVVVIDRATREIVNRIVTGGAPRRIVFNQAGTIAVIPNEFGWVSYIR